MSDICQRCGRYHSADHLSPPEQGPARWPDGPGHWCQVPATEPHDHHDAITTGPWLRWCDDPEHCERPDCDVSAYNARRDAHIQGKHDDTHVPECDICVRRDQP